MPPRLLVMGGALLALGAFISAVFSDSPSSAIGAGVKFVLVTVAWIWLGVIVLETTEQIMLAILAWGFAAAACTAAALAQLAFGDIIPGTSPTWDRMTGLSQHVNELGVITALTVIPLAAVALLTRGRDRYLTAALGVIALGGLVLSGSVSSAFALLCGLGVAVALGGRRLIRIATQRRVLIAGAVVTTVFVVVISAGVASGHVPSPWQRLTATTSTNTDTESDRENATLWRRVDTLKIGWERVRDDPLTGAGLNPDTLGLAGNDTFVHDTYLGTWAGLGFLSLLGLLLCVTAPIAAGAGLLKLRRDPRPLIVGLMTTEVAFAVYALATPALYRRFCWVPALLLAALAATKYALPDRLRRPASTIRAQTAVPLPDRVKWE
jgi:hypothetical protein